MVDTVTEGTSCTQKPIIPEAYVSDYEYGGLFLDRYYTMDCSGYVTAWHYCYYPPRDGGIFQHGINYTVELSFFQPDPIINGIQYTQKVGSAYTVVIDGALLRKSYACKTIYLSPSQYFYIQVGDFIGMYITEEIDPSSSTNGQRSGNILDILGTIGESSQRVSWRRLLCQNGGNHDYLPFFCLNELEGYIMDVEVDVATTIYYSNSSSITPSLSTMQYQGTITGTKSKHRNKTSTSTGIDGQLTHTIRPSLTYSVSTFSTGFDNLPFQTQDRPIDTPILSTNSQPEKQTQLVVPLAVGLSVFVLFLIIFIVSLVVVISVCHKRKAKLALMKWRKERRHVGLGE